MTVRDEAGRLTVYPFDWAEDHGAWQGPGLLDRLPEGGLAHVTLPVTPDSGLHVDIRTRTAGAWTTEPAPGLPPALTDLWPGWQVEFWEDRYEEQARACGDAVTFPSLDLAATLRRPPEKARGRILASPAATARIIGHALGLTGHRRCDPPGSDRGRSSRA